TGELEHPPADSFIPTEEDDEYVFIDDGVFSICTLRFNDFLSSIEQLGTALTIIGFLVLTIALIGGKILSFGSVCLCDGKSAQTLLNSSAFSSL
ncbi:hypothetical protein PENTCL1PPCAC_10630, partial [Pristionchus entomophagus]